MKKQACDQQEKLFPGLRARGRQMKDRMMERLGKGQEASGAQQAAPPTSLPWSRGTSPGKDFHVQYQIAGKTGGCEEKFLEDVSKLLHYQGVSLKVETFTENPKHLLLLFCPIASSMLIDIENALQGLGGERKVLLVVMHYVRKDNPGTPTDAKHRVTHPAVVRTVHTRFTLQDGFYPSQMNERAVADVASALQNFGKGHRELGGRQRLGRAAMREHEWSFGGLAVDIPTSLRLNISSKESTVRSLLKDFHIQVRTTANTGGCEERFLKTVSNRLLFQRISLKVKDFRDNSKPLLLLFCPIVSRMGTDIENALEGISGEQKVLLVVMHYTPKENPGTPLEAKHRVPHPAVVGTVHTRYTLKDGFYACEMNAAAVTHVAAAIKALSEGHSARGGDSGVSGALLA
ncbi:uncharacterized protein LOC110070792 [Pogona vitticeps]